MNMLSHLRFISGFSLSYEVYNLTFESYDLVDGNHGNSHHDGSHGDSEDGSNSGHGDSDHGDIL